MLMMNEPKNKGDENIPKCYATINRDDCLTLLKYTEMISLHQLIILKFSDEAQDEPYHNIYKK